MIYSQTQIILSDLITKYRYSTIYQKAVTTKALLNLTIGLPQINNFLSNTYLVTTHNRFKYLNIVNI